MAEDTSAVRLQPDISELILCNDPRYTCETYIFEPAGNETALGQLLAVAETEQREGVGAELLDLAMTAIQREYYRDPSRGVVNSFESALHQANLVLHDSSEQGVRDWMAYFNVVVGVLIKNILHISVSGDGVALLCRRAHITAVSYGLSHLPITNPLRSFSQVASGTVSARDIIFFGSAQFDTAFPHTDLVRLSVDHSASTIGMRLRQLYTDRKLQLPVAGLTISILPQHIIEPRQENGFEPHRRSVASVALPPFRKPLIIHTSRLKSIIALFGHLGRRALHFLGERVWPWLKYGSQQGKRAVAYASHTARERVQKLRQESVVSRIASVQQPLKKIPTWPKRAIPALKAAIANLPRSSKIFAALALLLTIAFIGSLSLLRHRRAQDADIQRASELLHEAQTKEQAAQSALIYDNREQAEQLLADASRLTDDLKQTGLYSNETQDLTAKIAEQQDRLQRIVRISKEATSVFADLSSVIKGGNAKNIFFANNALYTYNPSSNALIKIDSGGEASVVKESTEGIGFFTGGIAHDADKTIILLTKDPGIAVFDTKDNSVAKEDIAFPSAQADIASVAPYGTRLYVYDRAADNIYAYSKSLRGYSGADPWIKTADFPKDNIQSIAVDGSIYTLHSDGQINKLFKGEKADFKLDTVQPPLAGAQKIITSESSSYLYILDPAQKRVVIFTKKGALQKQIYVSADEPLADLAVSADEKTLYVLDGNRIITAALTE